MADLPFSCRCGKVTGTVAGASPSRGVHAICYCDSCRAAEIVLGGDDPAPDGVHIFQTAPDRLRFSTGQDLVAPVSFSDKGLLRWRAVCCDAPMFNTSRNPKISFVGIRTSVFKDTAPLGPVRGWAFVPTPGGKARFKGVYHLMGRAIALVLRRRITGRWKDTPFFDIPNGQPSRPVTVLPKGTRSRALASDA